MKTNFSKTKNLNRAALKNINGGLRPLIVNCFTLCGPAGGVISNTPGVGDACSPDRKVCCICN
ncbi:hypothetical protein KYG33_22315 [Chryseobacterium sp. D764]|uniref:hypothetical protein n=1 Tax=unclassified Chryseobacterium TaxID=2593645 RepID=UPI0015C1F65E|nr:MULTISPECIES: hypothetical protein [unclassified Chryseobacterium]QXU49449.1 hypothetical protein KYG33_22315 [Chryseobacterium sp. D764]CAD0225150.1 conserved protein of unknown function [Chryseobacterium sp. JV274]